MIAARRSPAIRRRAHPCGAPILVGLTLIRSNRGESFFMTLQYARATVTPSSLDKCE